MKSYIGTKIVNAEEFTRHEFESYYKSNVSFLHKDEPGYLVVYEDGYNSWSPKDVFERSYREVTDKEKLLLDL